jgi:hypothetical protein
VSKVELSLAVQHGSLDVGLHDVCAVSSILIDISFLQHSLDLLQSQTHLNAISAVTILTRFDNPCVELFLLSLLLIVLGHLLSPLMVVPQKLEILLILHAISDVEGERQKIKDLLMGIPVIIGHSIEEGLLVTNDVIVEKVVLHPLLPDLFSTDADPIF